MRKRLTAILTLLMAALLSWIIWIAATSYIRAPRMVAELDGAGALLFPVSELPRDRLCALLVVQDPTFYGHHGIGLFDGPPGHTTITQSIGKGLFFKAFNPGFLHQRKIQLMVAAWAFDRRISKETQLRLYLNRTYFGSAGETEVIGFPAAASAFFGKPLIQLTDLEFCSLLAMLEAPNTYHIVLHPKANAARAARIQQKVQVACREGCFQGPARKLHLN